MPEDRANRQSVPELLADPRIRKKLAAARKLTRTKLAKNCHVSGETVRRWQRRSTLYLSTLRQLARHKGGDVPLEVTFPDHPPVVLSGLGQPPRAKEPKKSAMADAKSKPKTRSAG